MSHSGSALHQLDACAMRVRCGDTNAGGCLAVDAITTEETLSVDIRDVVSKPPVQKLRTEDVFAENELLKKTVFQKSQELKLAHDRVSQLQDSNSYRREVKRMEEVVNKNEEDLKCLRDELAMKNQKVQFLEDSLKIELDMKNQKVIETLEESLREELVRFD